MFYRTGMFDNDCNLFEYLFCIFLWHNLYMTCHLSIYLHYKKMVWMIDIYYFPHCIGNQNIPSLFFHLRMTNNNKDSSPMGMYMRYYTVAAMSCRNNSIDLSNNLHLCMQCYSREAKISRHCDALLIHKNSS